MSYPNDLQPWKPPMLFQFCKVRNLVLVTKIGGVSPTFHQTI